LDDALDLLFALRPRLPLCIPNVDFGHDRLSDFGLDLAGGLEACRISERPADADGLAKFLDRIGEALGCGGGCRFRPPLVANSLER